MKMFNVRQFVYLLLSLIPISAFAIPALDLSRFERGDSIDATIMDTKTGLEWLNVSHTKARSYYSVLELTKTGGPFEGFRYATGGEVSELFDAFQLPFFSAYEDTERGDQFIDLFGATSVYYPPQGGLAIATSGFVGPELVIDDEHPMVLVYGVAVTHSHDGFSGLVVNRGSVGANPAIPHYGDGSFLVRDHGKPHPVPEINAGTAPIALSLLLLTALVRFERRRAIKS